MVSFLLILASTAPGESFNPQVGQIGFFRLGEVAGVHEAIDQHQGAVEGFAGMLRRVQQIALKEAQQRVNRVARQNARYLNAFKALLNTEDQFSIQGAHRGLGSLLNLGAKGWRHTELELRIGAAHAVHSCSNSQLRSSALFTMRSFPSFTDGSTPR